MRLKIWGVLLFAMCVLFLAPESAFAYNSRITIYAMVPEMRAIYVNKSGNIYKIAGNTSRNLAPAVFNLDNKQISMTDSISHQYQQFLKLHNYHLIAGKVYEVNPVSVNLKADTRTIKVESSLPRLSLGF